MPADGVLPKKFQDLFIGNLHEILCLDPLCKIVGENHDKSLLLRVRHMTDNIHCASHRGIGSFSEFEEVMSGNGLLRRVVGKYRSAERMARSRQSLLANLNRDYTP